MSRSPILNEDKEIYSLLDKLDEVSVQLDIQKIFMLADNKANNNVVSVNEKRIECIEKAYDNVIDVIAYLRMLTFRKPVIS